MAQGSRYHDVAWEYAGPGLPPPPYPPNMVYCPEATRSNLDKFKRLHDSCVREGRALKCITTASTPNLEIALLLVAGHRRKPGSRPPPATPAAAMAPAFPGGPASLQPQDVLRQQPPPQQDPAEPDQGPPRREPRNPRPKIKLKQQLRPGGSLPPPPPPPPPFQPPPRSHSLPASTDTTHTAYPADEHAVPPRPSACAGSQAPACAAPPPTATSRPLPEGCQRVFFAFFLPFKPSLDTRPGEPLNRTWLERRLKDRRGKEKDSDLKAWRDDRRLAPTDPATGLPLRERNVMFRHYLASSGGGRPMHVSLVESVLPGCTFHYSQRPWRVKPDDATGTLEPVTYHEHPRFMQECNCPADENCGKLEARHALRELRRHGPPYGLEVRGVRLEDGRLDLGVFATETIPAGTWLYEYVGELLLEPEVKNREPTYERAGLHYMYDLDHCKALSADQAEGALRVVDATHIGNVARFVNHTCEDANLRAVNVCMGGLDDTHMAILVRNTREILAGEELKLDYQAGFDEAQKQAMRARPEGKVVCRCKSAKCLGFVFPTVLINGRCNRRTTARANRRLLNAAVAAAVADEAAEEAAAAAAAAAAAPSRYAVARKSTTVAAMAETRARRAASGSNSGDAGGAAAGASAAAAAAAQVPSAPSAVPGGGASASGDDVGNDDDDAGAVRRAVKRSRHHVPAAAEAAAAAAGAHAAVPPRAAAAPLIGGGGPLGAAAATRALGPSQQAASSEDSGSVSTGGLTAERAGAEARGAVRAAGNRAAAGPCGGGGGSGRGAVDGGAVALGAATGGPTDADAQEQSSEDEWYDAGEMER